MKPDIKAFINLIQDMLVTCKKGYGMQLAYMRHQLEPLTKIMGLENNKDWQQLCFNWNAIDAQSYLKLTKSELLEHNGMSLRSWDANKITKEHIFKALTTKQHPLTPAAVLKCIKIKNKLTTADILKLAKDKPYIVDDYNYIHHCIINPEWLKCLPKKVNLAKLVELETLKDWIDYFGLPIFFLDRRDRNKFNAYKRLILSFNPPDEVKKYLSELFNFITRYSTVNPSLSWDKKQVVPLSLDPIECQNFETYIRIKGYEYHKEWKTSMKMEEHYESALKVLHECLLAKYNNNLRKEK